jgi:hypothetical protein
MSFKDRITIAIWLLIIGTLTITMSTLLYVGGSRGQEIILMAFTGVIVVIIMAITTGVLIIRGEKK